MTRRSFLARAGAAVALTAIPAPLSAQHTKRPRLIGVVSWYESGTDMLAKDLEQRFAEMGLLIGRDIIIEYRYAASNPVRAERDTLEIVARRPDVIIAQTTPMAHIVKRITTTIPIVAHTADALRTGLVQSLANPGGNLTGVSTTSTELSGKRVELLRELVPGVVDIAFLGSTKDPNGLVFAGETEAAAVKLGIKAKRFMVDGPEQFAAVFEAMRSGRFGGVVIQPLFVEYRERLARLAREHRLPAGGDQKSFAEAGLLFSYGTSRRAIHRKIADHAAKILGGAKPADIPVEQPTEYQFVINASTAQALGLTISPSMLAFANEVIE